MQNTRNPMAKKFCKLNGPQGTNCSALFQNLEQSNKRNLILNTMVKPHPKTIQKEV